MAPLLALLLLLHACQGSALNAQSEAPTPTTPQDSSPADAAKNSDPSGGKAPPVTIREIRIVGTDRFREQTIRGEIHLKAGDEIDAAKIDQDRQRLLAKYHNDGYVFATVDVEEVDAPFGRTDLAYIIDEGTRVRLRDVRFDGADTFLNVQLQAIAGLVPQRGFGLLSRGAYAPGKVDEGLHRVGVHYIGQGFFDVQIEIEDADLDTIHGEIDLRFRVREGARYDFAEYRIEGRKHIPQELIEEILDLETGVPYSRSTISLAGNRLRDWYLDHSDLVPLVGVEEKIDPVRKKVLVTFRLTEGRPLQVGDVDIVGNKRTLDRVVRQRVSLRPGMIFSPRDIERSESKLRASQLFKRVDIHAKEGSSPEFVNFLVDVEDNEDTGYFELGGGASSGAGSIAYMNVVQRNFDLFRLPKSLFDWKDAFIGGGQSLQVEVIPGTRESEFNLVFSEPYFFSSKTSLQIRGSSQIYLRESYDLTHFWGDFELRQYLDDKHRLSAAFAYHVEDANVDDIDANAPPRVVADAGHTFLSYPRLSLRYSNLEINKYSGPQGWLAELSAEYADEATGSEASFTRANFQASYFAQFFDDFRDLAHTLQVGANVGWVDAHDGGNVPIYERYYVGGPKTFRGYRYRGLGPRSADGITPLGGDFAVRGTVQYSLPIFIRELRLLGLVDWGTLESSPNNVNFDRFRVAVGGGIQIRSPLPFTKQLVPINLYWTEVVHGVNGDRERLFTFGLGFTN